MTTNEKIRENSIKDLFMKNKDKIHFVPFYDFLTLMPSYRNSKEALLLAYLLDEDGKTYNRHPDMPSWFRCPRQHMAEATLSTRSITNVDDWLANLQAWGFIKYESLSIPKEPPCTYVEIQSELIKKLATYYNQLIADKKYDEIIYVHSMNSYIYTEYIDIYILSVQTYIHSGDKSNNSINNSNNNGSNTETPHGVILEPNKNNIYISSEAEAFSFDDGTLSHGYNITAPKAWFKAIRDRYDDWAHAYAYKLDEYLDNYPDQKKWILGRDLSAFLNGIDEAVRIYGKPNNKNWKYKRPFSNSTFVL